MVVGVFGRSLSFQSHYKNPNRPTKPPPFSHHTRSISLPSRSHPLVSQLKDSVSELHIWSSSTIPRTSTWLFAGLSRLSEVHDSLDDILQLPQTLETLSRHRHLVEKLLEDLIRFVDAYGIFQTLALALKEEHGTAQVAIRKKDDPRIASYLRTLRKVSREMRGLVDAVQSTENKSSTNVPIPTIGPDAELIAVILSAVDATVNVSATLFSRVSASFVPRRSSPWCIVSRKSEDATGKKATMVDESIDELRFDAYDIEKLSRGMRKMKDEEVKMALKRMQEIENCIRGIEGGSEKVFRRLISTRVSLLNTLTHTQ